MVHPALGTCLWLVLVLLRVQSVDLASAVGGFIGRTIGPRLKVSRRADHNLRCALPELDTVSRKRIVVGMWDNLGRVMGEYPHLYTILNEGRITFIDHAGLQELQNTGRPIVFFGAHLANWELLAPFAVSLGLRIGAIYRTPNNRFADRLVRRLRARPGLLQIRKGASGAKESVRLMMANGALALLADQKLNTGVAIPFFGQLAMTAPTIAQFALHYEAIVLPARVQRLGGAHFRVTLYPPIEVTRSGDMARDVERIMAFVNQTIEGWIREQPEQWLWLHRRWPN